MTNIHRTQQASAHAKRFANVYDVVSFILILNGVMVRLVERLKKDSTHSVIS